MKKLVPQGESKLVNGLWYNQGEEYEAEDEKPEIVASEAKQKKQSEKKEEG